MQKVISEDFTFPFLNTIFNLHILKYTLEIACFNYQSAIMAANAGADRIEICDNMHEGGTTPSYGMLKLLKEKLGIPIFCMIRARGGDFFYNREEFDIMQKDIGMVKKLGFGGVVFGFLNRDGTVDKENTRKFVNLAYPMEVTFHRAFDRASDPFAAMEDIIGCGCQRILTSGQKPKAPESLTLLQQLIKQADERIIIMPGSGVRSNNIELMVKGTGATEYHSSAGTMLPTAMDFINLAMDENLEINGVDEAEIIAMKKSLFKLANN